MIIDVKKSKYLFGTDISIVKKNSCKIVICYCENPECRMELIRKYRQAIKNKNCIYCANKKRSVDSAEQRSIIVKEWHKNNKHPLLGTKRPPHVIEALRKSATGRVVSEETREKRRLNSLGDKNHFFGKKHTEETKKKISEKNSISVKRGSDSNFFGKIYHPKKKNYKYGDIYFRSSWELKVAVFFDKNNIKWDYEKYKFILPSDIKKEESYTPDFYLIDHHKHIEVKGYWRLDASEKFERFKKEYPDVVVEIWDKEKLKQLNIL